MSANGFTLLWSKILDSSIWMEDAPTRLVWITMLAMKNKDGVILASVLGVAHRARVTVDECEKALSLFLSPDKYSSNQENEGRRIRIVPGGWQVINHESYRYSSEAKRDFWKAQKAEQRERNRQKKQTRQEKKIADDNEARERRFVKAVERGDEDRANEIAAEGL